MSKQKHDDNNWKSAIFERLQASPLAPHIRVFGSAAIHGSDPKDVDIFVDFNVPSGKAEISRSGRADLLKIAKDFYGHFDPYFLVGSTLFTRNAEATGWITAKNAPALIEAGKAGVSLSDLMSRAPTVESVTPPGA
jgi:predicted nucleotidyltransferase